MKFVTNRALERNMGGKKSRSALKPISAIPALHPVISRSMLHRFLSLRSPLPWFLARSAPFSARSHALVVNRKVTLDN